MEEYNNNVLTEIKNALQNIEYGSVEIIVQDGAVTQISTRVIRKTNFKQSTDTNKNTVTKKRNGISVSFKY
ncbi:MAG: YezD family protein [Candidatus Levybacteria bacterium]|nr:YezD family protein [Candidatus Levybacteria bacterium]